MKERQVVVVGAGPAGLTAAYELSKHGVPTTIVEKDPSTVGGISRTVEYKGFRYDIGGHRFFTKSDEVNRIWHEILTDEFITRPRLSRIYYNNKFFHYPLRPFEALFKVGPIETAHCVASYLWAKLFPSKEEVNFEQWVSNRFGFKLYSMFFKTYTEKVWGMKCTELGADWAAQRIQNLSLGKAIKNALFPKKGDSTIKTLIDQFEYPRLGPGQMWERCRDLVVARGHRVAMGRRVHRIHHHDGVLTGVTIVDAEGNLERLPATDLVSSMPISEAVRLMDPRPPAHVLAAADKLRYRDFLTVSLVLDAADLFPDNWIYVHSPEVQLGRIQNFKNWSPHMVPDPSKTCLGLEYFVFEGKGLWAQSDEQLVELGGLELEKLGLASRKDVRDGSVVRMEKAYPVYDAQFQAAVDTLKAWLGGIRGIQQVGRNGQHRYNNQDHSMLTAIFAARNILGANYDIWNVNVDAEYHETMDRKQPRRVGDVTPTPVA
ncbi:MAG: NAD(P)/FAD-dependent oxidoreductase [Planctomycetes bacterium]|nr:NAD(P)/FAD-dependent oxidoreductase [Planctomycetota bacterium]